MGEWIWQQLTSLIGRAAGGKPGTVGWDYAAGAAAGTTPAPSSSAHAAAAPIGGGNFGPANDPNIAPGGVDPAWWAAMLAARAASMPPERPHDAPALTPY